MDALRHSRAAELRRPLSGDDPAGPAASPDAGAQGRRPQDGLSHVEGARDEPLWALTVGDVLERAVQRFGAREAACFREQGLRLSYGELARRAEAVAAGLLAAGLEKGDRVGLWAPNRAEWLIAQFATARAGLVLVTINPAYRLAEVEHALTLVQCRALITAARFRQSDYHAMLQTLAPELSDCPPGALRAAKLPDLRLVVSLEASPPAGMLSFAALGTLGGPAQQRRLQALARTQQADDPINIQFTSGTTGAPKGATLSHRNIVNNARFCMAAMAFGEDDSLCIPVPLYHCFGMVLGTLGCATVGARMVFPGEAFDAGATLTAVAEERCSGLYGVPTMFVAALEHADFARFDLAALRTGIMAGAPCPIEVMRRVVSDMHLPDITIAYGMTETSPISFQTDRDDPLERRVATVGRVHPHVEVKIVDEAGATVPVGAQGELCTRGYSVMRGYWGDETRSAEAVDGEGWMHTGDLARLDAEGYCNIVGRVKDMLIRGGENIYPREIEEFLFTHPAIQEVQVFGVPDDRYGEEICAWVVPRTGATLTPDEVVSFCQGQIAHFKVPRHVRIRDALPMTVTGKPQKFAMREAMIEELGRQEAETA